MLAVGRQRTAADAQGVLNQNPFDLLNPEDGIAPEFRGLENALWDTIGKILGKPAYQLDGWRCLLKWVAGLRQHYLFQRSPLRDESRGAQAN